MSHHKGGHHLHKHHRDTHHGHQKISKFPLYCEKNLWSQTFAAWKKYDVKRARLPKVNEERLVDMHSNIPHDLTQFIGTHNEDCMKTFTTIRETFEDAKSFPHLLTLVGPSGSGKSSMMYAFMIELASFIHLNTVEKRKKLYLWMDGKKHLSDFQKLWSAITRYLGSDIDRQVKVNYRFIILDNADFIPPSYQQSLKRIIEEFSNSSKFILIVNDSNKIISSIQSKAVSVRTRAVGERDCLLIILNILHRNHIGHDREAIKEIFHHFKPHYSISNMLDFIQELFQKYEYVSLANVLKKLGKVVKPHVSAVEVLQPLQRCDICTLVPPCKHYDSEILVGNAIERRSKNGLPRYKGGMVCPDWARFGHCTFYNNNGHCSLDHPRNIHVVDDPLIRCPSCTIPWPCNHCSFSPARVRLHKLISDIRGRLSRIKQLVAPDPPYSLTKHIVSSICAILYFAVVRLLHMLSITDMVSCNE